MNYFRKVDLLAPKQAPRQAPKIAPPQPKPQEIFVQKEQKKQPLITDTPKERVATNFAPQSIRKPLFEPSNLNLSSNIGLRSGKEEPYGGVLAYENQVWVRIKSPDREEWRSILTIKIEMRSAGAHSEQALIVELTDEKDPLFLFSMECGESDFYNLKAEQNLLVDFQQFPGKFIELLEQCQVEKNIGSEEFTERFACIFCVGFAAEASLSVVEINQFKQLTHLSLKFTGGNDEDIKKCLAKKLQEFKAANEDLRAKLENTENSLSMQVNANEKIKNELKMEKEENRKIGTAVQLDSQKQLNDLKQQMLEELTGTNNKHADEIAYMKQTYESQINELATKLQAAQTSNTELLNKKSELEANLREYTSKTDSQAHEIELQKNELTSLRGTNKNLDSSKYSQEKTLIELSIRCETMQKQVADKEEIVSKTTGLYESTKHRCAQLDESMEVLKANASKMEEKLILSAQEINKGNEIIKQLQGDLKAQKQKIKVKEGVITQQEQAIEQHKRSYEDITRALNDCKRDFNNKDEETKSYKAKIDEMKAQIEECKNNLASSKESKSTFI